MPRRATRSTRVAASLTVALVAVGLAGCSGDSAADEERRPSFEDSSGSSTGTPSPSGDPGGSPTTPSAPTTTAVGKPDAIGNDVFPRQVAVSGPDQEAVAQAWLAYWRVRIASYGAVEVLPEMGEVATQKAMSDVVNYVATLDSRGHRTEGDLVIDVDAIEVDGDAATLSSCMDNYSTDRDAAGEPVELLEPYYDATAELVRQDGAWRVSLVEIRTDGGPCS